MKRFLAALLAMAGLAASAAVTPLPGSTPQTAPAGSLFAPVRVRVTDTDGNPVAGAYLYYNVGWYWSPVQIPPSASAPCFPDLGYNCEAVTDSNGEAQLATLEARYPGPVDIAVRAGTKPWGSDLGSTTIHLEVLNADGTKPSYQGLWWGGPLENGWGLSTVQHGDALFNAIFAYDANGDPTWYVQPDGAWYQGVGSSFGGDLYSPRSAPYFAYDASRFAIGGTVATASIHFYGPENGDLNLYSRDAPALSTFKHVSTLDFSPDVPTPNKGIADLWWGGIEQNGWGITIAENGGNLFAVWFTYDADGKPVWFPMEAGAWVDDRTYRGTIFRVRSAPWPLDYDPSRLQVTAAGTFSLHIDDLQHLTFTYSLDGHEDAIPLTRLDF